MVNTEWVHDLKVVELKEECKKRGLAVSGKKAELAERLEAHIKENEKSPTAEPSEEAAAEESPATAEEAPPADAEPAQEPAGAEAEVEEPTPAAAEEVKEPAQEAAAAAAPEAADAGDQEGAAAEPAAEEAPAAMEEDAAAPAPAAEAEPVPAATADVVLDYGEESEGEGAAPGGGEPAQQQEPAEAPGAAEGGKRKRGPEGIAARLGPVAALPEALAPRPSKTPRTGAGGFTLGSAEKGAAPAPEDVPAAAEPATRALRIDGFVRPFTERQVRELLSETGQVLALWMPSIKTHAYAVFESRAQAEETRRATYQLQWPATNPKRLAPRFVPLAEAETAIGTGAGNPDFRLRRMDEDGEEEAAAAVATAPEAAPPAAAAGPQPDAAAVDRSQREWNRNRRSPSPPLERVTDLREVLKRRLSGRGSDGATAAAAAGPSPSARAEREAPLRRGEREPERRDSGRGAPRQEERVLTLDELFRKTASKPCIYWLPLSDEQIVEKKRRAEEAAAAAAAAAVAPPAAENGTAVAT